MTTNKMTTRMLHMNATIPFVLDMVRQHPDWFEAGTEATLLEKQAAGEKLVPMGDCPNFDSVTGCPGHSAS